MVLIFKHPFPELTKGYADTMKMVMNFILLAFAVKVGEVLLWTLIVKGQDGAERAGWDKMLDFQMLRV